MASRLRIVIVGWIGMGLVAGCSKERSEVQFAPANGTVIYKGNPLAGATVTFVPAKGPLAIAITDVEGKFTLNTGALPGVAVGAARVSISFAAPAADAAGKSGATPSDPDAYRKKMLDMQASAPADDGAESRSQSLIPEKYTRHDTSDLQYTVKADGDNHFQIELQD
jgi:hypothetical protein